MKKIRYIFVALVLLAIGGGSYFYMASGKGVVPETVAAQTAPEAASGDLWTKRCAKEGEAYCEIFQRLAIKETGQRLIEFAVGYPKKSKDAQAVVVLPLGIVMTSGIMVQVDDGEAHTAAVRSCNQEGCYTLMSLPAALVDSMKVGKRLTVGFFDGQAKPLKVELSLSGFATQLEAVR